MKKIALLLAAGLCLTGCKSQSSTAPIPETTAPIPETTAANTETAADRTAGTTQTTAASAPAYPVPETFSDPLSDAEAAVLTQFSEDVLDRYLLCCAAVRRNEEPAADFLSFGAPAQLNAYLRFDSSKEITVPDQSETLSLRDVQTESHGSYAVLRGTGASETGSIGVFVFVIGSKDGSAVLLDLLRDTMDSPDLLNRPDSVSDPTPDFWTDPEQWKPFREKFSRE